MKMLMTQQTIHIYFTSKGIFSWTMQVAAIAIKYFQALYKQQKVVGTGEKI